MTILGFFIFVVGLVGLGMTITGIGASLFPVSWADPKIWGIVTAIGGVLYFFTRRAKD